MSFPNLRKAAPIAEKRPESRVVHEVTLHDDYGWLRAGNWQEAIRDPSRLPEPIGAYLKAENDYARRALKPIAPLKSAMFAEMKGRMEEDTASVPVSDGPYDYYERFRDKDEQPLICRRPRAGGDEQVLLDANREARRRPYFDLGEAVQSPDHALLGWSADDKGNELFTLCVRDLKTGKDRPDAVPDTDGSLTWQDDAKAFYYVRLDDNHRPSKVFRHALGTQTAADEQVFAEGDAGYFLEMHGANAGGLAFIGSHESDTSEIHTLDLTSAGAKPVLVATRRQDNRYWAEYHPDYRGEKTLFIRTDLDGAEDFCVMTAPLSHPDRTHWRPFIPYRKGVMILAIYLFRNWLVRLERENALPRIVIHDLASAEEHAIGFDEAAYALFIDEGLEFDTDMLRFVYSSMTTPQETWDYNMRTRERVLRKRQHIPSGHEAADYVTERVFATAPDGEQVPISLVYKKGLRRDGSAPLLLYGYGAYGAAMPARFSAARFSLVDRGFVYAIAHIRGGSEKGESWYKNGKRANKMNTFTDFIACAEHLMGQNYTRKGRIVAHGGSAGGMLMGAIANMRPDLFAGIVADVPFVDVTNTILDDTLPLTPPEWPEWGDPINDRAAFALIRSYSPYDNVKRQDYPHMLVLAGLSDPRVTYWEPAKWVAKLRACKTDGNRLVLLTNMDAGHGGDAGRFKRFKEVALSYAFAAFCVGITA